MKFVFYLLPDDEVDTYNDMYNDTSTEKFVTWINRKYEKYLNIIINEVPD